MDSVTSYPLTRGPGPSYMVSPRNQHDTSPRSSDPQLPPYSHQVTINTTLSSAQRPEHTNSPRCSPGDQNCWVQPPPDSSHRPPLFQASLPMRQPDPMDSQQEALNQLVSDVHAPYAARRQSFSQARTIASALSDDKNLSSLTNQGPQGSPRNPTLSFESQPLSPRANQNLRMMAFSHIQQNNESHLNGSSSRVGASPRPGQSPRPGLTSSAHLGQMTSFVPLINPQRNQIDQDQHGALQDAMGCSASSRGGTPDARIMDTLKELCSELLFCKQLIMTQQDEFEKYKSRTNQEINKLRQDILFSREEYANVATGLRSNGRITKSLTFDSLGNPDRGTCGDSSMASQFADYQPHDDPDIAGELVFKSRSKIRIAVRTSVEGDTMSAFTSLTDRRQPTFDIVVDHPESGLMLLTLHAYKTKRQKSFQLCFEAFKNGQKKSLFDFFEHWRLLWDEQKPTCTWFESPPVNRMFTTALRSLQEEAYAVETDSLAPNMTTLGSQALGLNPQSGNNTPRSGPVIANSATHNNHIATPGLQSMQQAMNQNFSQSPRHAYPPTSINMQDHHRHVQAMANLGGEAALPYTAHPSAWQAHSTDTQYHSNKDGYHMKKQASDTDGRHSGDLGSGGSRLYNSQQPQANSRARGSRNLDMESPPTKRNRGDKAYHRESL